MLITLPCPTIARWTVGFKCCTYCEYNITIMLPSLVQLYTEPSNATQGNNDNNRLPAEFILALDVTTYVGVFCSLMGLILLLLTYLIFK